MENIGRGVFVCVCVEGGGGGGGKQGVCENGGWLEISPFGVTTWSGECRGMRG